MGNVQGSAMVRDEDPVAKVMLPDGSIDEYTYGVEVNKLMALYPDFMVVHCSSVEPLSGQLSGVTVMEMGDTLVPGRSYILYPVPQHFQQDIRAKLSRTNSVPDSVPQLQSSASKRERLAEVKRKMDDRRRRKLVKAKSIVREMLKSVKGSKRYGKEAAFSGNLYADCDAVCGEKAEGDGSVAKDDKKMCNSLRLLLDDPYAWRPDLDCIPESPLGYHDRPQSPYVLQGRVGSSRGSSGRSLSGRSLSGKSSGRSSGRSSRFATVPEGDVVLEKSASQLSCLPFFAHRNSFKEL